MERADGCEGFTEFVVARGPALSRSAYLLTGDHQLATTSITRRSALLTCENPGCPGDLISAVMC